MANLKDLKVRIKSVKNTQKITSAMKMVAASKLRRAQDRAEAARPYSQKMGLMLTTLADKTSPEQASPLLVGKMDKYRNQKDDVRLLIVATADRGLCGSFNSGIVRAVKEEIVKLESEGKEVKILTVGSKGYEQLRYGFSEYIFDHFDTKDIKSLGNEEAETLTSTIIELFEKGTIDGCSIVYNSFISALTQKVTFTQLIPLDVNALHDEEGKEEGGVKESLGLEQSYEYEPEEEQILEYLLPRNIRVQVLRAFLENEASEHGARMTAMDNATRNAGEMIKKLTLQYNRTRQAAITTELTEIISGAEAV